MQAEKEHHEGGDDHCRITCRAPDEQTEDKERSNQHDVEVECPASEVWRDYPAAVEDRYGNKVENAENKIYSDEIPAEKAENCAYYRRYEVHRRPRERDKRVLRRRKAAAVADIQPADIGGEALHPAAEGVDRRDMPKFMHCRRKDGEEKIVKHR